MTKAEYQKQNDEMRGKIAAYESMGSPEGIKASLEQAYQAKKEAEEIAKNATTTLSMIKKLLA